MQISDQIIMLKSKYEVRLETEFIPITMNLDLRQLEENGNINKTWFLSHVKIFYSNCLQYLEQWSGNFKETDHFSWVSMKNILKFEDVQKSLEFINSQLPQHGIDDGDLLDEVSFAKKFSSTEIISKWNEDSTQTDQSWLEMFLHCCYRTCFFSR